MTEKISKTHLQRRATVYLRQSTLKQVHEHRESTARQYDLRERAVALGWDGAQIDVIDDDLGQSGTSTDARDGFQRMAEDGAHGRVGAIFSLDVSRLARSSADWHRLLDLCGLADMAIVDEQAVYSPRDYNDRLLLGLKRCPRRSCTGIKLRLHGSLQSKARRGELRIGPPTGYVWGGHRFELDPDESVQAAIRLVFERYSIEPSAYAVARWAQQQGVRIPVRRNCVGGVELAWSEATVRRIVEIVRNPVYAGVYVYGRRQTKEVRVGGEIRQKQTAGRDP